MSGRAAAALAPLAALVLALAPAPATAADVTLAEFGELAAAAPRDPAALRSLLAVDAVDGRAVDVRTALRGAEGDELDGRLASLERGAQAAADAAPTLDAEAARERAIDALQTQGGQPGAGQTGAPGVDLGLDLPLWLLIAIAVAVVVAGGLVAWGIARRRVVEAERLPAAAAPATAGPGALDREADRAEGSGDFATAVRLRFRAGLERLDAAGVIRLHPALTASAAARAVGASRLPSLVRSYERIAYGRRPAGARDAADAREGWVDVLAEVRRR